MHHHFAGLLCRSYACFWHCSLRYIQAGSTGRFQTSIRQISGPGGTWGVPARCCFPPSAGSSRHLLAPCIVVTCFALLRYIFGVNTARTNTARPEGGRQIFTRASSLLYSSLHSQGRESSTQWGWSSVQRGFVSTDQHNANFNTLHRQHSVHT